MTKEEHELLHQAGIEHDHEAINDYDYNHDNDHSHDDDHSHDHNHGHDHSHSHSHGHKHVHSAQEKKAVINRLSRAIGHLESVKRMIENDADCSEVLVQLAAVRNAINNTGKVVLKNHISHCIVEAVEEDDMESIRALNDAIDKFIK